MGHQECGDTSLVTALSTPSPVAAVVSCDYPVFSIASPSDQILSGAAVVCRHEVQRVSERLATFPRARDSEKGRRRFRRIHHKQRQVKDKMSWSCVSDQLSPRHDSTRRPAIHSDKITARVSATPDHSDYEETGDNYSASVTDMTRLEETPDSDDVSNTLHLSALLSSDDDVVISPRCSMVADDFITLSDHHRLYQPVSPPSSSSDSSSSSSSPSSDGSYSALAERAHYEDDGARVRGVDSRDVRLCNGEDMAAFVQKTSQRRIFSRRCRRSSGDTVRSAPTPASSYEEGRRAESSAGDDGSWPACDVASMCRSSPSRSLYRALSEPAMCTDDVSEMMSILMSVDQHDSNAKRDNSGSDAGGDKSLSDAVDRITEYLGAMRVSCGRPSLLSHMNAEQLLAEKDQLQRALLFLESAHGRPRHRLQRQLVRPLYDRYRVVKRLNVSQRQQMCGECVAGAVLASSSSNTPTGELTTIHEHEPLDISSSQPSLSVSSQQLLCAGDSCRSSPAQQQLQSALHVENLHNMSSVELKDRLRIVSAEKRRLKQLIKQFETLYMNNIGKKLQKDDRGDMTAMYAEYKQARAHVKLLQVLISKALHRRSF